MILLSEPLADDPAGCHYRQVRNLLAQILHCLGTLLLDLGAGFGNQALRLLTCFHLEFSAQVLSLLRDPVQYGLRFTTGLLELRLAYSFGLLEPALGPFRRFCALLEPLPAFVQDLQQGAP